MENRILIVDDEEQILSALKRTFMNEDYVIDLAHSGEEALEMVGRRPYKVVISDDMQMGAIREFYSFEESIRKAIEAGLDILAIANNSIYDEAVMQQGVDVVRGMVADGVIPAARIEASAARIRGARAPRRRGGAKSLLSTRRQRRTGVRRSRRTRAGGRALASSRPAAWQHWPPPEQWGRTGHRSRSRVPLRPA